MLLLFSHSSQDRPSRRLFPGVWYPGGAAVYAHSLGDLLAEGLLREHLNRRPKEGGCARPASCGAAPLRDTALKGQFLLWAPPYPHSSFWACPEQELTVTRGGQPLGWLTSEHLGCLVRSPHHRAGFSLGWKDALCKGQRCSLAQVSREKWEDTFQSAFSLQRTKGYVVWPRHRSKKTG